MSEREDSGELAPTDAPPPEAAASGTLGSVLRWLPGFAGYYRQEDRARSDALQRDWLADRLERGKQGLERYARLLADAAQLDRITAVDRLRRDTDQLVGRIRGAVRGGGGFFGDQLANATRLEEVYQLDLSLIEIVAEAAEAMDRLSNHPNKADETLAEISSRLDALSNAWDVREDRLREN